MATTASSRLLVCAYLLQAAWRCLPTTRATPTTLATVWCSPGCAYLALFCAAPHTVLVPTHGAMCGWGMLNRYNTSNVWTAIAEKQDSAAMYQSLNSTAYVCINLLRVLHLACSGL